MTGYIYCHPVIYFITEIFASPRLDFSQAAVLTDPRTFSSIHNRDHIVILSTLLLICKEYGAADMDPMHVVVLMELPIYTRKSAVALYLQFLNCGLCPPRQHNIPVIVNQLGLLPYFAHFAYSPIW